MSSFILSTQLGPVTVEFKIEPRYDVENIIRDRAYSQAMAARLLNKGKSLNPNNLSGSRTLSSVYATTTEELPT
jgi:hypothetical protein